MKIYRFELGALILHNKNLIYSPNHRIPIGESVKKKDGTYIIRVKKHKSSVYDEFSLDYLCNEVISKATTDNES